MATYAAIHAALVKALTRQGQPVQLAPMPAGARPFQAPDACAGRAEPNDLIRSDDGRKVAGAAQKRNRHGLLIEGYVWKPFLPGCDWSQFEQDFVEALGEILVSPPVAVPSPIYDQFDHEGTWAKFSSAEWNQRI
jgi:lipoate-protein ligase A